MADTLKLRGGTTTDNAGFTGADREVTVDTTKKTLVVHDGTNAGGTPLMKESGSNAASSVGIGTSGTNAIVIDSSQRVLQGHASARKVGAGDLNCMYQIEGTSAATGLSITRNNSSATTSPKLVFGKSAGSSTNSNAAVSENHVLGEIRFSGADGTDLENYSASIVGLVDGGVSGNQVPGRLEFRTGTTTDATTKMTIHKDGKVGIGTTEDAPPTQLLTVRGTILKTRTDSGLGLIVLQNDANQNGVIDVNQNAGVTRVKLNSAGDSYFNGGSVSIGTTLPDKLFHVERNDDSTTAIAKFKNAGTGDATLQIGNADRNFVIGMDNSDSDKFKLGFGDALQSITGITLDTSGNAVVGSTTANGSDACTLNSDGEVRAAGFYFSNNVGSAMSSEGIRRLTTGTIVFDTASTPRMTINGSGDVGIGTTTMANKLEVVGTIQANVSANTGSYTQAFNITNAVNADFNVHLKTNSTSIGSSTNTPLSFHTGGSANPRMTILSSGGITFNGETSTANALDDYEEGTWTPTFQNVSAPTYTSRAGKYTKIGRFVYLTGAIVVDSGLDTSDASAIAIGDLPFAPAATHNVGLFEFGGDVSLITQSGLEGFVNVNVTTGLVALLKGSTNLAYSQCNSSGTLKFAFTYETDN